MNSTIVKFGYPNTLLRDYSHWVVLLRPQQVTLGSLVLACKDAARSWPGIPHAAFVELKTVTDDIESTLRSTFEPDRVNYLMLMMADPHVHFHVIPRYESARSFDNVEFVDSDWPKPPDLLRSADLSSRGFEELRQTLAEAWGLRT